jgi:hypothetical protein
MVASYGGCSSTSNFTVVTKPQLNLNAGLDTSLCSSDTINLNASATGFGIAVCGTNNSNCSSTTN